MRKNPMMGRAFMALGAFALSMPIAVSAAPPAGALPGDEQMSCPAILAEVNARNAEMDSLQAELDQVEAKPSVRTHAVTAAATVVAAIASHIPSPVIGTAISSVGSTAALKSFGEDMKKAEAPLTDRHDFALERMDWMSGLYRKKCR